MCERNSGGDRRAVDLSRSTLGQALPPREIPHKPMSWQRGMIPCSKLVGISVTPYKTAAKLNPEITVASRTRRTSESLTGGSHRSLPTPNRPAEGPLFQPSLSLNLIQPQKPPHLHLIQPVSPLLCISSSPTELSLYLTQPGSLAVTHQLTVPILSLIQSGRRALSRLVPVTSFLSQLQP